MIIFVAFVTLYIIGSPDTVYNLNHRRPHYKDLYDAKKKGGVKSYRALQSDITTALSVAASATRAAAAWWASKLLWRYAFMLMEKGEITMAGFSKAVNGGIMTLLWPRDVANRKNVFLAYLIIFTCFGMDYSPSILTGSVTWQASFIKVKGSVPLMNITQGIPGTDISYYRNASFYVSAAIEGGAALELVSWGLNTNSSNLPIPSNITRRAIIQSENNQTIQNLLVNSTLDSIRLPYFRVDKFEYITDPDATLTSKQKLLLNDSSVYNPYSNDQGLAAFLPDTSWGPGFVRNLPDPVNVSESRILSILLFPATSPNCSSTFIESFIPSSVNFYPTLTTNSTYYSCFAFANVTYVAGAAICQDCTIIAPAVVEGNVSSTNLRRVADPLTIEALAITPSVASHTLLTTFADFSSSNLTNGVESYVESYVIEFVSRAYQAAWSYLVIELGDLGSENQTNVVFAIPASHPSILRWRVYFWAGLHLGALLCGITFAYWHSHYRHSWFSSPTMIAFQLDTTGIFKEGGVADPKDPWDPAAKYPAGRLQLQDYDHGQPRAVALIQDDSNKLGDVLQK